MLTDYPHLGGMGRGVLFNGNKINGNMKTGIEILNELWPYEQLPTKEICLEAMRIFAHQFFEDGVGLIAQERAEHITKHKITTATDEHYNPNMELCKAATGLLFGEDSVSPHILAARLGEMPDNWDLVWENKAIRKPYKERLIIAGALIAAEIDRLQAIEQTQV
jgi:hypothetical protein